MLKIRSFQMRIALLSVLCSTLALAGSAIAAWRIGWSIALSDIDTQARSLIRHGIGFPSGPFPRGTFGPDGYMGPDRRRGGGSRRDNWRRNNPPDNATDAEPPGNGTDNGQPNDGWRGGNQRGDGQRRGGGPRGDGGRGGRGLSIPWMPLQQDQPPGEPSDRAPAAAGSADDSDNFPAPEIFVLRVDASGQLAQISDNWPDAFSSDAFTTKALALLPKSAAPAAQPAAPPFGMPGPGGPFAMAPPSAMYYAPPQTLAAEGRNWRVIAGASGDRGMVLGVDLTTFEKNSWRMASAFLWTIPFALAFIAIGAAFTATRALRPMNALIGISESMTARGLDQRIVAPAADAEFRRLIDVFNGMMDRLERSFRQANRFSADAAHELRTPLTILQGQLERMFQESPPGSPGQQEIERLLEEIHRVKSIVEKLLLLARMDAGQVRLHLAPLDMSALCENIVDDLQAIAPRIAIGARIEPGIAAGADAALLETAIQNVGMNAVKYNDEKAGRIEIDLSRSGGRVRLSIASAGPRIAEADREKIFDRFYRADPSRSRQIDGAGLGLSLAREIVLAHHGWLVLDPTDPEFNRFDIILPEASFASAMPADAPEPALA
jgi:signal transduction histidine kinase